MTDYDLLYSKFQFKDDDAERLIGLHKFASACCTRTERLIVITTVTDGSETEIIKQEAQNAKLV